MESQLVGRLRQANDLSLGGRGCRQPKSCHRSGQRSETPKKKKRKKERKKEKKKEEKKNLSTDLLHDPAILLPAIYPWKMKTSTQNLYTNVHNIIYNCQKVEITQVSTN